MGHPHRPPAARQHGSLRVAERKNYNDWLPYWNEHRRVILVDWIKHAPGNLVAVRRAASRSSTAWLLVTHGLAPRLIEARLKLCGEGLPLHEALSYAPPHHYGIPAWFGDPDNSPAFDRNGPT